MKKYYLSAFLAMALVQLCVAQTKTYSRLIWQKDWASADTTVTAAEIFYSYSGNRGGGPDTVISFDTQLKLKRKTDGSLGDTNMRVYQVWDGNGGLIESTQIFDATYSSRLRNTCDSRGNVLLSYVDQKLLSAGDTFAVAGRYQYVYSAAGLLDSQCSGGRIDGDFVVETGTSYRYDGAGRMIHKYSWKGYPAFVDLTLTIDNAYEYAPSGKIQRSFSSKFNKAGSTWDTGQKLEYYYGPGGDLDSMQTCSYEGGGNWKVVQVNVYKYDAAHRLKESSLGVVSFRPFNVYYYDWEGDSVRHILFMNGASRLDSFYKTTEKYNENGQLIFRGVMSRATAPYWYFEHASSYVYELYTLSVQEQTKGAVGMDVWPVPATDQLQVKIALDVPTDGTLLLYDMQGKVWTVKDARGTTAISETFPVAALPAGMYFVQFRGADGTAAVRKVMVCH
jgi:hypothetical protein